MMNETVQKKLKNNVIKTLMSEQFKAYKSKKWFKKQLVIKKITVKVIEFEIIIKKIMKTQKVIADIIKNEENSEMIIINNIFN